MNLAFFDVREYLDSRQIAYSEAGKNISEGNIGIECPFCPDGDPSNHLGIHLDTNLINCWRCGTRGTVIKLIMKLERCSFKSAQNVLNRFKHSRTSIDPVEREISAFSQAERQISLPAASQKTLLIQHRKFLRRRGFSPNEIFRKYDLACVGKTTKWKFRLIIPIVYRRKLVAWTSRDVTGQAEMPYRNASNDECVIPVKKCVYNLDNAKETMIVAEGPLDVWRLGDGAVCTFGTQFTKHQVLLIASKAKRVFILYDSDAEYEGARLAYDLSTHVPSVEIIDLDSGDPADMTEQEVGSLRREIFGKIF